MQPAVNCIHELFIGVEALGSQPDLHLGDRQNRTVRRMVENFPVEEID
jgi:hypothetical protein